MSADAATHLVLRWWREAVAGAVSLATAFVLVQAHDDSFGLPASESVGSPRASTSDPPLRPAAAPQIGAEIQSFPASRRQERAVRDALGEQSAALRHDDRVAYVATWSDHSSRSRQRAQSVYANLAALRLRHISLQLVRGSIHRVVPTTPHAAQHRDWTASILSRFSLWRDSRPQRFELTYEFVWRRGHVRVRSIETAPFEREPSWLQGQLTVKRAAQMVVVGHSTDAVKAMTRQLSRARRDVLAVTGAWADHLVVRLPRAIGQAERTLGSGPGGMNAVAAVATTVDGSTSRHAEAMIVTNPEIWSGLSSTGLRLVLTHELAHAATAASSADTDAWVVEGFADYVAFEAFPMALHVTAGPALRDIHRNGYPDQLPANGDFSTAHRRQVPYAQSWVVWRTLAQHHGDQALLDFYAAMVDHPRRLDANLRTALGTTEAQLTHRWVRELERLCHLHRGIPAPR